MRRPNNYYKKLIIAALIIFPLTAFIQSVNPSAWLASAQEAEPRVGAPVSTFHRNILPITDSTYELGTSTRTWKNVYVDEVCLAGDCKTVWPTGGSGGGGVSDFIFTAGLASTNTPIRDTAGFIGFGSSTFAGQLNAGTFTASSSITSPNINGTIIVDGVKYPKTGAGIQTALDDAYSLYAGGTVFLPCATYLISSQLNVSTSTQLVGENRDCTVLLLDKDNLANFNFGYVVTPKASSEHVTVKNLTIDGDYDNLVTPPANQGGLLIPADNWTIENVIFDSSNYFMTFPNNVDRVVYRNNIFRGNGSGVDCLGGGGVTNTVVEWNVWESDVDCNAWDWVRGSGNYIGHNTVQATGADFYLEGLTDTVVEYNTMENNAGIVATTEYGYSDKLYITNPYKIKIRYNELRNGGSIDVLMTDETGHAAATTHFKGGSNEIVGNTIASSTYYGIRYQAKLNSLDQGGNIISGNTIINANVSSVASFNTGSGIIHPSGINIMKGKGFTVNGNTISIHSTTTANAHYGIEIGQTFSPSEDTEADEIVAADNICMSGATVSGCYNVVSPTYSTSVSYSDQKSINAVSGLTISGGATTTNGHLYVVGGSAARFGVGTSSPDSGASFNSYTGRAALHVGDSANNSATRLLVENGWTANTNYGLLVQRNNSVPQLAVTGAGNVGIGTSTPGSLFSIQSVANFKTGTSTLYDNLLLENLETTGTVSGTNYRATGLTSCDTIDTDENGNFKCGTDDGGSFAYPFPSNATTTALTFSGGITVTCTDCITDTNVADLSVGGDVSGTLSNIAVTDDSHAHTGTTISGLDSSDISGLDISDDTNLTASGGVTLTGDNLTADLGTAITTGEITDGEIIEPDLNADDSPNDGDILTYDSTGTNFVWVTCADITGSADLCDGTDATGGGGATSTYTYSVCASGCDYSSIDTAVDSVAASSTLLIKNGNYDLGATGITVPAGKSLSILGESRDGVHINYTGSSRAFSIGDDTADTRYFKMENISLHVTGTALRGFSFNRVKNSHFQNLNCEGAGGGDCFRLDGTGAYTGDNHFYGIDCRKSQECISFTAVSNSNHFYGVTLRTDGGASSRGININSGKGNSISGGLVSAESGIRLNDDENYIDGIYCEANTTCVEFTSNSQDNNVTVVDVESNTTLVIDAGIENSFEALGDNGRKFLNGVNFGLGTSTPGSPLSVHGNGLFSGDVNLAGLTATGTVNFTQTSATTTIAGGLNVAGTAGLTVLQNGKVGINDTTPENALNVIGAAIVLRETDDGGNATRLSAGAASGQLDIYRTGSAQHTIIGDGPVTFNIQKLGAARDIIIHGDTVDNIFYADVSADAVGFASSTPWRTLSVDGTVAFNGLSAVSGTDDTVCIDPLTKELTTETGADCTTSSARFKHNIETLNASGLDILDELRPVSFVYNGEDKERWGFIAEDLAAIDPKLANYNDEGQPQNINERSLLAVIADALKELKDMVFQHEDRIDQLEKENDELKARLERLEANHQPQ